MKKFRPNMSDEELDALFREAASEYQPPDKKKEGWALLEQRLSNSGGKAWWQNRNIYWMAAALMGLMIGVFAYYHNDIVSQKINSDSVEKALQGQHENEQSKGDVSDNKLPPQKAEVNNAKVDKPADNNTKQQLLATHQNGEARKENSEDNEQKVVNNMQRIFSITEWHNAMDTGLQQILPLTIKPVEGAITMAPDSGVADSSALADKREDRKKEGATAGKRPFSIQVAAGPDWSTVKFKKLTKPGWDLGLKLGYQFARSWTVQTGIMMSDKDYNSDSKDYELSGNIPDRDDVDEIAAKCRTLTVPLNISYSLSRHEHHALSVSLGLSSYWFLKEEYTYHYKNSSGARDRHWELENMNKNILSVINISMAYEYYLKQNFGLTIEPYLQLPASKIGYGRVSMQSGGINLGATYHF